LRLLQDVVGRIADGHFDLERSTHLIGQKYQHPLTE